MARWTLDDIPWDDFRPELVDPDVLAVVKTSCLVEHNSATYGDYLCAVFDGDDEMCAAARTWAAEEIQHGLALKRWASLADPDFDGDAALAEFAEVIKVPEGATESVRGSRLGELVSRCIVEVGTSSFYSSLRDKVDEPVLKAIAGRIAADEFAHYALFHKQAKRYGGDQTKGAFSRLKCALGRIAESEDDELGYAWHCATGSKLPYKRARALRRYQLRAYGTLACEHYLRALAMILRAVGLNGKGWLHRVLGPITWRLIKMKIRGIRKHPEMRGEPAVSPVFASN
jgi:hypothetical protein